MRSRIEIAPIWASRRSENRIGAGFAYVTHIRVQKLQSCVDLSKRVGGSLGANIAAPKQQRKSIVEKIQAFTEENVS
jgi:hypothetical protein